MLSNKRCFVVAGIIALAWTAHLLAVGSIKVGDRFPDLGTFNLEGNLPDSLKGKVVIVDFWASWCGPCRASFPVMEQLHKEYSPKGLVIVAVNLDDNSAAMNDFLKKHPASFTVVRDAAKKLVTTADITTMPTSFVLDTEGRVHSVHNGFEGEATRKRYVEEIQQLLPQL